MYSEDKFIFVVVVVTGLCGGGLLFFAIFYQEQDLPVARTTSFYLH